MCAASPSSGNIGWYERHYVMPSKLLGEYLRSIRRGERPLDEVLDAITDAETQVARLHDSAAIPGQPDRAWVDDWLHRSYLDFWTRTQ
jgi:hypothetical protein